MRTYVGLFALAALVTVLVTPLVERLGRRLGAYGNPRDAQQDRAVPRLGGLAIFAASLACWGVLLLIPNTVRDPFGFLRFPAPGQPLRLHPDHYARGRAAGVPEVQLRPGQDFPR